MVGSDGAQVRRVPNEGRRCGRGGAWGFSVGELAGGGAGEPLARGADTQLRDLVFSRIWSFEPRNLIITDRR